MQFPSRMELLFTLEGLQLSCRCNIPGYMNRKELSKLAKKIIRPSTTGRFLWSFWNIICIKLLCLTYIKFNVELRLQSEHSMRKFLARFGKILKRIAGRFSRAIVHWERYTLIVHIYPKSDIRHLLIENHGKSASSAWRDNNTIRRTRIRIEFTILKICSTDTTWEFLNSYM